VNAISTTFNALRFAAAAIAVFLSGCQSLSIPLWNKEPQPSAVVVDRPEAVPTKELSPKRAAEVCLAAARELDKQGHEAEAIVLYEKAREHNPDIEQVSRRLAVLYDRQGNSTKAREEYRHALAENPRDADLLNDIGYFFYQRGQLDEAEKWLQQSIDIEPNHARAWVNLGLVYGQQGRYHQSFEAFSKVVSPAAAHSNVGAILAQNGNYNLAQQVLRQAVVQQPDLQQSRVILAHLDEKAQAASLATISPLPRPGPTRLQPRGPAN
jgi:tetratricopeptide (TPR) repeat protein